MPSETDDNEFDLFWSIYPRHIGKLAAQKAFAKARTKTSLGKILEGLKQFVEMCAGRERQFIPYASTWLNGERWLDEPDDPPPQPSPSGIQHEEHLWRLRVKHYRAGKFWLPIWGGKPDDPYCLAPAEVLREFGYRAVH